MGKDATTWSKGSGKDHPRSVLNHQQAIEIFKLGKLKPKTDTGVGLRFLGKFDGNSSVLAKLYGVSPKAIRDIWNRRTWTEQTRHLWAGDESKQVVASGDCTADQKAAVKPTDRAAPRHG